MTREADSTGSADGTKGGSGTTPTPAGAPQKSAPLWIKILVGLGAALLFAVVGTCSAGVIWLQRNREALTATAKDAMRDGARFGENRGTSACVAEALKRLDSAEDLVAESANKVWLEACLQAAALEAAACVDVPPRKDIVASATWAIGFCAQAGRENNQACARLVGAVQERCLSTQH